MQIYFAWVRGEATVSYPYLVLRGQTPYSVSGEWKEVGLRVLVTTQRHHYSGVTLIGGKFGHAHPEDFQHRRLSCEILRPVHGSLATEYTGRSSLQNPVKTEIYMLANKIKY